jgi:hypothetical protein
MIIRAADNYLISKLEKVTHWVQRWTGKTNYWLSSRLIFILIYMLVAEVMFYFVRGKAPIWLGFHNFGKFDLYYSFVLVPVLLIDAAWGWKVKEQLAYDRLSRGLANPSKIRTFDASARLLFLLLYIGATVARFYDLYLFTVTLLIFLNACDPLPPCQGKIKEWLISRKLVFAIQPTN